MDRSKINPNRFFGIVFPVLMIAGLLAIAQCAPGEGLLFWVVAVLVWLNYAHKWTELLYAFLAPQRYLPSLDIAEIPPACTVVAMSTLLRSEEETRTLLENLERNYHANPEGAFLYCLLADFQDSDFEKSPEDERLVRDLESRIADLNRRYGNRFLALIRQRRWNESEKKWMSWERKRGKLTVLNRWLLGKESDAVYSALYGAVEMARAARFVLPLDEDSWIENGGALRLLATLAHPANLPAVDESGRLTHGYSILSPAIKAFNRSIEPYNNIDTRDVFKKTRLVRATLFGQMYCGKGIYEVRAFERTTIGFPENRILSHDRLEGLCGSVAFVPDVTIWEEVLQSTRAYFRRYERWVRGDIQALVMFSDIAKRAGMLAAWNLLVPVLRAVTYPALLLLWIRAFFGGAEFSSVALLSILGVSGLLPQLPHIVAAALVLFRISPLSGTREFLRCVTDLIRKDLLNLRFFLHYACSTLCAICKSTFRLVISKRNLLEWLPAGEPA